MGFCGKADDLGRRRKGLASEAKKAGGGPAGGMGGTSGGAAVSAEATTVAGSEDPNAMQVDEEGAYILGCMLG